MLAFNANSLDLMSNPLKAAAGNPDRAKTSGMRITILQSFREMAINSARENTASYNPEKDISPILWFLKHNFASGADLSRASGYSQKLISQWKCGKHTPSSDRYTKIMYAAADYADGLVVEEKQFQKSFPSPQPPDIT